MALNRVHGWRCANTVELCLDSMTVISINVHLEHEYQRAKDLTGAESHFRKCSHGLNVRAGFVKVWQMCFAACAGEGFTEPLRGHDCSCYQHQRWGPCADPENWFGISPSLSFDALSKTEYLNLCCQNYFVIGWIFLMGVVNAKMGKWCLFRIEHQQMEKMGTATEPQCKWPLFLFLPPKKNFFFLLFLTMWPVSHVISIWSF